MRINSRRVFVIFIIFTLACGISGCGYTIQPTEPKLPPAQKVKMRSGLDADVEDVTVGSEPLNWDDTAYTQFFNNVMDRLSKRDFAGLDNLAAEARLSKARFVGGGWEIHSFYKLTSSPRADTNEGWNNHIRLLKDWKAATGSMAARVSLANLYLDHAWRARGTGYSNDVPREALPVVEERLNKAVIEIMEAAKLKEQCYGYFETMMHIGRSTGMEKDQYEKVFAEAVAFDPTYQYFYTEKAQNLLPRWHGSAGEFLKFANGLSDTLGENDGLKVYYMIAEELLGYGIDPFKEAYLSWKKTKKGFVQLEKDHGLNPYRLNNFATMAIKSMDAESACNTFKRFASEKDFDASVWPSRQVFESQKNFVLKSMCKTPKADPQV